MDSPCIKVCKIDKQSGYCIGCFRTIDEIRLWQSISQYQRQTIQYMFHNRQSELTNRGEINASNGTGTTD